MVLPHLYTSKVEAWVELHAHWSSLVGSSTAQGRYLSWEQKIQKHYNKGAFGKLKSKPFGFRWCPFRIASLYEEGGESQLNSYHESMGHTAYGDLSSASASAHVCPYLALHGHTPELNLFPRHPSADIMLNSNVFPNAQNHNWQPSAPHFGPRLSRNDATSQQQQQQQRLTSFLHPHPVFHGLVPSLSTQEHRASRIYQPSVPHSSLRTPPFVPARRTRLSATSSSSASGSRGQQEAEGMVAQRFDQLYGWGPLPWIPLEGDPQWWGPFAPNPPTQSGGSRSENGNQRM